jgi:hypothetical protein
MKNDLVRAFWILAILVGCGDDHHAVIDAGKDAAPDAEVRLDCPTYCAEIQANCTGANAQYADMTTCMAACTSFQAGASKVTDTSGNTLGCRIYHAGAPAKSMPAVHCPHAGPGGDQIPAATPAVCSGGDICESFCALEIKACGSLDAPLPGSPTDATGNPLFQYQNMDNCKTLCAGFDKTHPYSLASAGDSLACRLLHATSAAIAVTPNAKTECRLTGLAARAPCSGTPTP